MMYDAVILGAGAAGLLCAWTAAQRGVKVCVLDLADIPGRKMRVCGGGYGNFANREIKFDRDYFSDNPHFAISALKRFPSDKVLRLMETFGFDWELRGDCYFLTEKFVHFIDALHRDAEELGVEFRFNSRVTDIQFTDDTFAFTIRGGDTIQARQCVIACGSSAYPQLGGNTSGLEFARKFGHGALPFFPGLAPIRFDMNTLNTLGDLSGIAMEDVKLTTRGGSFRGSLVFRPDGIGGIAVFRAASAWAWHGGDIAIDWLPGFDLAAALDDARRHHGVQTVRQFLAKPLPRRLAAVLPPSELGDKALAQLTCAEIETLMQSVHAWRFMPAGTGGSDEAEVMLGGVLTDEISSKTLESALQPGLFFCGEVLDVTGQLGGYNLHWAFASGHCVAEQLGVRN